MKVRKLRRQPPPTSRRRVNFIYSVKDLIRLFGEPNWKSSIPDDVLFDMINPPSGQLGIVRVD